MEEVFTSPVMDKAFLETHLPAEVTLNSVIGQIRPTNTRTWLFVPVSVGRDEHTPPPEAHSPVEAEQGVAVGFLIKLSIHELLVQGAQLGHVGLAAHGGAAVLVPVLRPDGHRQIHGGQYAQHTGDDQGCGVAVVNHCSPRRRHVKAD